MADLKKLYNGLIEQGKSLDAESLHKAKIKYFKDNILPQVESKGLKGDKAQKVWDDFSSTVDGDLSSYKSTAPVKNVPKDLPVKNVDLPIKSNESMVSNKPTPARNVNTSGMSKSIGNQYGTGGVYTGGVSDKSLPTNNPNSLDAYSIASKTIPKPKEIDRDKAVDYFGGMVMSPELISKLRGEKPQPKSEEERIYRQSQRGKGRALAEGLTSSNIFKVATDPTTIKGIPGIGTPLAIYLESKKINKSLRRKAGKLTGEELLEEKYPYQPEGLVEKVLYGSGSALPDAVPTYMASRLGASMPQIMGGMGFLSSFLDTKKKAEQGKELGFSDFQNMVRSSVQGAAMGKVASTVGKYSEKVADKAMAGAIARQERNIGLGAYNKVMKPKNLERLDNVVRTGTNTVGDIASFGATRLALEGKMPSTDDFISDMISSFAMYKGMGRAAKVDAGGGTGVAFEKIIDRIGNYKTNKKTKEDIKYIFDQADKRVKSGEFDNETAKQYLEENLGGLFARIKGKKSNEGVRDIMKDEIRTDKNKIIAQRSYDAIYNPDAAERTFAMDSLKTLAPEKVVEIQKIIDEEGVSAKRYGGEPEDPKKIYEGLGDEYTPPVPKELQKIKKEKFQNQVSEKSEIGIRKLVERMSKEIDAKLKDGIPLNKIELMEGYSDKDFAHLNGGQRKAVEARTLEVLKDNYGLGDNLKFERQYLRELRDYLSEREKVWKKTDNVPDDIPDTGFLSPKEYDKVKRALMQDKTYTPEDRKLMLDEIRKRVRKGEDDGKEIESKVAIGAYEKSVAGSKWTGATSYLVKPKNADDKIVQFRVKNIDKKLIEKAKDLLGKDVVDKAIENEKQYALPIYESNVRVLKDENGISGKYFDPVNGNTVTRIQRELLYNLQQASRVFENLVSKEFRKMVYDPVVESRANATYEIRGKLKELKDVLKPLNRASRKRVATHLYSEQEDAAITLSHMGVKPVKAHQLTMEERKVVNYIREEMKSYIERVNLSRVAARLKPIDPKDGYFTIVRRLDKFIKDGGNPSKSDAKMWNNDDVMKEGTKLNSEKLRKKAAAEIELSLDLEAVMGSYIKNTLEHVHVSPITSKVRALLDYDKDGFSFKTTNPALHKYASKWLDSIVGVSDPLLGSPLLDKKVRKIMSNVASASLVFNVTTMLSQPEALFNTAIRFTKEIPGAIEAMFKDRNFAKEHSPALYTRTMDVTVRDAENAFNKGVQGITDMGMWGMKKLDSLAAELHWYAVVGAEKRKQTKTGRSDAEIYRIADQDMVNSHSSGDMAHIAPIQRNTAGKLFTQFMTFQMNQWYSVKRDIFGVGNKNVSKMTALKQGIEFTLLAGLSNTIRESIGLEGMYPSPITAIAKGLLSEDGSTDWQLAGKKRHDPQTAFGTFTNVLAEFTKIIPLGNSGYGAVSSMLRDAWKYGVDRKDYQKFAEKLVRVLGVPGSGQMIKIKRLLDRMNKDRDEREAEDLKQSRAGASKRRKLDNNMTAQEERRAANRERNAGRRRRSYRRD